MPNENKKSNGMLSAIISGAGNALSSVLDFFGTKATNEANERNVRATNEMNYKIAQEANAEQMRRLMATQDFDVQQWSRNNAYNSFAAQMQRARDAGLNPQSIVQNSPSTQVTSQAAPNPVTPTMQAFQEMPNSWKLGDVINRVSERLDKMFEHRQILREDKRAQEKHNFEMLGLTEDIVSKMKANMNDKTAAEKRKAEAEADDLENQVTRNVQAHNKSMQKADSEIKSIDKGIEKTQHDIELDDKRYALEERAQKLAEAMGRSSMRLNQAQINNLVEATENLRKQGHILDSEDGIRKVDKWFAEERKTAHKAFKDSPDAGDGKSYDLVLLMEGASAMQRANMDEERINDWLRSHLKVLGLSSSLGATIIKGISSFK